MASSDTEELIRRLEERLDRIEKKLDGEPVEAPPPWVPEHPTPPPAVATGRVGSQGAH